VTSENKTETTAALVDVSERGFTARIAFKARGFSSTSIKAPVPSFPSSCRLPGGDIPTYQFSADTIGFLTSLLSKMLNGLEYSAIYNALGRPPTTNRCQSTARRVTADVRARAAFYTNVDSADGVVPSGCCICWSMRSVLFFLPPYCPMKEPSSLNFDGSGSSYSPSESVSLSPSRGFSSELSDTWLFLCGSSLQ
jgi:hypothetical protein